MKILRHERLRVGDIVLTTSGQPVSFAVRTATKGDISHAMLCVDTASVIDATLEGVHARNTQRLLFDDHRAVHVLRLKVEASPANIRAICDFVRQRIGTAYAKREAVQTVLGGSDVWSRKQFCSRLVAQAYASRGYALVPDPNYCSPKDLVESDLLEEVTDCVRTATSEDVRFTQTVDLTKAMRDATNAYLDGVREVAPHVLDTNDVDLHLQKQPEHNDHIHGALQRSGYLNVWQMDVQRSPWHYDLEEMEQIGVDHEDADRVTDYCRMTVADAGETRHRYAINARGYAERFAKYRLSTFEELAGLYAHLQQLHALRLKVAAEWLSRHDPDAPMPIVETPHSEEWFAELGRTDPKKAAMTRAAIQAIGREDCCSICGDDPAPLHRLNGNFLPGERVPTLRLCEDCVSIRASMGEPFVPIV